MKLLFNITDSDCDLERYASRDELLEMLEGFDGLELMHCQEDARGILPPERIVGLHMSCPYYWLDFWRGDRARCLEEFGTDDALRAFYGDDDPQVLVRHFREELETARRLGAEYVVFHVSDSSSRETLTGTYAHTDQEVIDGACDLINQALPADWDGPLLLLENLWEPGLTFTDPAMTARLLEGICYPRTGIMLDTGHLMHTQPRLRTQREALEYIHSCLEAHGGLCRHIRGVHLHQSLTGGVMRRYQKAPPEPAAEHGARMGQLFEYVFQVDRHRPFTCPGVRELVERIGPDYLTCEFISSSRQEHAAMLRRQLRVLNG